MNRPTCCNRPMYPCGGVIGKLDLNKLEKEWDLIKKRPLPIEHHWRCGICGQETHDIFDAEISTIEIKKIPQ